MKLNQIKNLLADEIETYSTTIRKKDEKGDLYDYEYELKVNKQDPGKRLLRVLLLKEDNVYEALKELEVKTIYCGNSGFIVELNVSDPTLFEKLANENQIPLTTTKYSVVED